MVSWGYHLQGALQITTLCWNSTYVWGFSGLWPHHPKLILKFTIVRNSFHRRLISIKNEAWQSYVNWDIFIAKANFLIIKIFPLKFHFDLENKPFGLWTCTFGILLSIHRPSTKKNSGKSEGVIYHPPIQICLILKYIGQYKMSDSHCTQLRLLPLSFVGKQCHRCVLGSFSSWIIHIQRTRIKEAADNLCICKQVMPRERVQSNTSIQLLEF